MSARKEKLGRSGSRKRVVEAGVLSVGGRQSSCGTIKTKLSMTRLEQEYKGSVDDRGKGEAYGGRTAEEVYDEEIFEECADDDDDAFSKQDAPPTIVDLEEIRKKASSKIKAIPLAARPVDVISDDCSAQLTARSRRGVESGIQDISGGGASHVQDGDWEASDPAEVAGLLRVVKTTDLPPAHDARRTWALANIAGEDATDDAAAGECGSTAETKGDVVGLESTMLGLEIVGSSLAPHSPVPGHQQGQEGAPSVSKYAVFGVSTSSTPSSKKRESASSSSSASGINVAAAGSSRSSAGGSQKQERQASGGTPANEKLGREERGERREERGERRQERAESREERREKREERGESRQRGGENKENHAGGGAGPLPVGDASSAGASVPPRAPPSPGLATKQRGQSTPGAKTVQATTRVQPEHQNSWDDQVEGMPPKPKSTELRADVATFACRLGLGGRESESLRGVDIGGNEAAAMVHGLRGNSDIQVLDLSDSTIRGEAAELLSSLLGSAAVPVPKLRSLIFARCPIGDSVALVIWGCLARLSITLLDMRSTLLSPSAGQSLAKTLIANQACKLQTLNLSGNSLLSTGAAHVASALAHCSCLLVLNLDGNGIDDSGAAKVAEGVAANTSLHSLHLANNEIGLTGAMALAQCWQGRSSRMRLIDITGNKLSGKAMTEVQRLGKNVLRIAK